MSSKALNYLSYQGEGFGSVPKSELLSEDLSAVNEVLKLRKKLN